MKQELEVILLLVEAVQGTLERQQVQVPRLSLVLPTREECQSILVARLEVIRLLHQRLEVVTPAQSQTLQL